MARMTSTSNANLLQDVFLYKRFIEALRKSLVVAGLGAHEDVKHSTGKTCRWQYFANPVAFPTALAEGADPTTPSDLATTAITASILEYGQYYELAKLFLSTAASGTQAEIVDAAGYAGSLTLDTLAYTLALQDCTNTNDINAGLDLATVRLSCSEISTNNAMYHPKSDGGNYYILILSPEQMYDLMGQVKDYSGTASETTWADIHATDDGVRGAANKPFTGAARFVYEAQIVKSTNVQQVSSEELAYLLGKDAFGSLSLDGDLMNPRVIVTNPEERVDKPLRNSGTVGVHMMAAFELIDSNRVVEIKSNVT